MLRAVFRAIKWILCGSLAALFPPEKRIQLAERLTVRGGPSLPAALDWLAADARRVAPAP